MPRQGVAGTVWTDGEIELVVSDYFDMLRRDLAGEAYNKAARNLELQTLTGRSRGSIEYKLQNVSAVLERLGRPYIPGYKPMRNFQKALIEGVERYLSETGFTIDLGILRRAGLAEGVALYIDERPPLAESPSDDPPALRRLVRKFDPAETDARNRELGRLGEQRVLASEKARLAALGRDDLAQEVRWIAEEEGDGAGYDILSFSPDGAKRLLEVKTTTGHQRTPFFLTANEKRVSEARAAEYRIFRVYDFLRQPRAFEIAPPLEQHVVLSPTSYRAAFS